MATISKLVNLTSGKITLDGIIIFPKASVDVSGLTNKMLLAEQNGLINIITTTVDGQEPSNGPPGSVLYQMATGLYGYTAVGLTGQVLVSQASGAPKWSSVQALSLTSGQITAALGYVPYNADTNPNGYITSIAAPVQSVAGKTGVIILDVADVNGAAGLFSPAFTGVPTAPTAAPSTNNNQLATTAFVKAAVAAGGGGPGTDPGITLAYIALADVADVTLLEEDYANDILILSGALTVDVTVTVPNSVNSFVLVNATTGPFTVSVKTEFGTGITIAQGYESDVYSDGTTLQYARTFYKDTKLVGLPTAPTPDLADSSDRVATTKFVKDQQYITAEEAPVQTVFGRVGDVVLEPEDLDPFLQDFSLDGGSY